MMFIIMGFLNDNLLNAVEMMRIKYDVTMVGEDVGTRGNAIIRQLEGLSPGSS